MTAGGVWVLVMSAGVGSVGVPPLTVRGARLLADAAANLTRPPVRAAAVVGLAAGAAGARAASRAGSWWWLPGLLPWAVFLAAAAVCDARTQRIPVALVWAGVAATATGLLVGAAGTGEWRVLLVSALIAAASTAVLWAAWRFAGAGFGDVRLAALGGLGLGHTRYSAILLAVVVFAVVFGVQAGVAYVRTRDRHAMIPVGPALAGAFLVAAVA